MAATPVIPKPSSLDDLNAPPKCYAAGDLFGGVFGIPVIPGGIVVFSVIDVQRVIVGGTFPWTDGGFVAGLQVRLIDRVQGKVMIALYNYCVVGLGYHFVFPDCFHGWVAPVVFACGILKIGMASRMRPLLPRARGYCCYVVDSLLTDRSTG